MGIDVPAGGKARRTYENLLEAIRSEIAATGSFTAERAAARGGSSLATFYTYFPSKEDALTAAFARALDRLAAWVEEELRIERLLELGLAKFCADFVRGCLGFFAEESPVFRLALSGLSESRDLRVLYRDSEDRVFQLYHRFIELGQAAGKLREGDPHTMARAMLVVTQGFNNPTLLALDPADPLHPELRDVLVRLLAPVSAA
ncbi:MAG: TetR/AcrR family transcriptional regulator [Myxococcota bacterium]|jgi:AcrR family transcriptional regulator|nr:TetR/AcrR family transcriptional regulator [Myxococcota bacterium]